MNPHLDIILTLLSAIGVCLISLGWILFCIRLARNASNGDSNPPPGGGTKRRPPKRPIPGGGSTRKPSRPKRETAPRSPQRQRSARTIAR